MEDIVNKQYKEILEVLVHGQSVASIREIVRTTKNLNLVKLREILDKQVEEASENNDEEKCNLLMFIQELIQENPPTENASISGMEDVFALYRSALKEPNIIRIRRLLLENRHLVTEELVVIALDGRTPYERHSTNYVKIVYVASVLTGNHDKKMVAYSLWISNLIYAGYLKKARKRIGILKQSLTESENVKMSRTFLALEIAYAQKIKDFKTALQLMEGELKLMLNGDIYGSQIEYIYTMASIARKLGQYERAIDLLNEMLRLLNVCIDLDEVSWSRHVMKIYHLRALVYEHIGRFDLSLKDFEQTYRIATESDNKSEEFLALTNMAASFSKRGLYQESLFRYQEILEKVIKQGDLTGIASTHNNIGTILASMDRYAEALPHYFKAFITKFNTPYKYGEAIAALGLAECSFELNERNDGEFYLAAAWVSIMEAFDANLMAKYVMNRVRYYTDSSEQEENLKQLEMAYGMAVAQQETNAMALLIPSLCVFYTKMGREDDGVQLCEHFSNEYSDQTVQSGIYYSFLNTYAKLLMKKRASVKTLFEKLMRMLNGINKQVNETVIDRHRSELIGQSITLYNSIFDVLLEYNNEEELIGSEHKSIYCFDLHEQAKSRSFLSDMSMLTMKMPPQIPEALHNKEQELIGLYVSYQQMNDAVSDVYRVERLEELRRQLFSCREDIKAYAPEYVRARLGMPYTYEEVQQFLSEQPYMAFISFFCDKANTTVFVTIASEPEPRVFRYAVGNTDIEKIVRRIQKTFNGDPFAFPPSPPILPDQPFDRDLSFLDQLGQTLLAFLSSLPEVELLCIAPHGPLHQLPFQAVRLNDGRYLAERFAVIYTPSISTTLLLQNRQQEPRDLQSVFIASVASKEEKFPDLFEQDISIFDTEYWQQIHIVKGVEASREKVRTEMTKHDIIHFSCHGYVDSIHAQCSGLILSNGTDLPTRYGHNLSWSQRNQFALTVKDILTTSLRADMVTLNACSTAFQVNQNFGDEMDGFIRSLMLAGASTVISTMWNVDQGSSVTFLRNFYKAWQQAGSRTAKWKALSYVQKSYIYSDKVHLRHPYHWAAFTLSGNWH